MKKLISKTVSFFKKHWGTLVAIMLTLVLFSALLLVFVGDIAIVCVLAKGQPMSFVEHVCLLGGGILTTVGIITVANGAASSPFDIFES